MVKNIGLILLIYFFFILMSVIYVYPDVISVDLKETVDLKESIEIALRNSISLKIASQRIESSKSIIQQAKSAKAPILGVESTYSRIGPSVEILVGPDSIEIIKEETYDIKGYIRQPLYTGGRVENLERQARDNVSIYELEYERIKQDTIFNVRKAYFTVLQAQGIVEVSKQVLQQAEVHLKLAQDMYKTGVVPKFDVLRAEVQVANIKQNLISAENNLKISIATFNNVRLCENPLKSSYLLI